MAPADASQELTRAYRQGFEALRDDDAASALPHFQRALEIAERQYGVDDPRTAVELNNLGEVFRLVGDNRRAAAYLERALAIEREHGTSASVATTMNNLALSYRSMNQLESAELLYEEALQLLQSGLGPNHPDVAKALNNLAMIYAAQGHSDRALLMIERAVQVSTDAVGTDHPTTRLLARNEATMRRPSGATKPSDDVATLTQSNASPNSPGAQASNLKSSHFPIKRPLPIYAAAQPQFRDGPWMLHVASLRRPEAISEAWNRLQRSFPMLDDLELNQAQPIEIVD
ncbi:MAG: tetratricopeptide repeat protein [Pseudomonadota bacterium]